MKGISIFYTWFWVIYFPLCIAFDEIVKFDFSDELLTVALLCYAIIKQRFLVKSKVRTNEIWVYIGIMAFYLGYSFYTHVTTPRGILLDFLQQIRPYAVFYLTWMLAPDFTRKQKKWILYALLSSFIVYLIAFIFDPSLVIPYFSNDENVFDRESAALGQIAMCCGMVYFLFTNPTKRNRNIAVVIMLVGLVSGKSKYFGECIAFIALVVFLKNKIKFDNVKTYLYVGILGIVIIFFTWTKFNAYYIEGMTSNEREMARPLTYQTGWQIMKDYFPFGSGLGTFACAAAAKEYSPLYYKYDLTEVWGLSPENPMFLADTFYPIVYSEYGLVGAFLFLWFWVRRLKETRKIIDPKYYKMALMCILALALESTADSSYLSGKGMGYFMILAVCLNSNYNAARRKKRLEILRKQKELSVNKTKSNDESASVEQEISNVSVEPVNS